MGIGVGKILVFVLIVGVILLLGSKRLRSLGSDVGESVKGFRRALDSDES